MSSTKYLSFYIHVVILLYSQDFPDLLLKLFIKPPKLEITANKSHLVNDPLYFNVRDVIKVDKD